jgi:hypothetical protein
VLNEEKAVHLYALIGFTTSHNEYMAVFKRGAIFGEFAA